MKKSLQTTFHPRQYMLSPDFEIYYYNDRELSRVDFHTHNYYEFYIFLEGDVSIEIGQRLYPVKPGDIMLILPHVRHRPVIHSQDKPYRRFVFWISPDYCDRLATLSPDYTYLMQHVRETGRYLFHMDRIAFNAVQSKALRLIEEMHARRFGRDAQISLYVSDLVLSLNRLVHEQNHPASKSEAESLYQQIAGYIEEHLDEDLSLERLADAFFVSKYHISHIFKDSLGISIHQYITKKRLALCREAIRSNQSITEAYQSFGFGDYSSFYRAFKKEYGISPKDFRDMQVLKY